MVQNAGIRSHDPSNGGETEKNRGDGSVTPTYGTRSVTLPSRRSSPSNRRRVVASNRGEEDRTFEEAATILSILDEGAHEEAIYDDSERILQNFLLPRSLPWHKPKVTISRTLPRDIDDMRCIWYACDDICSVPHGSVGGAFGFGSFDQGFYRPRIDPENQDMNMKASSPHENPQDRFFGEDKGSVLPENGNELKNCDNVDQLFEGGNTGSIITGLNNDSGPGPPFFYGCNNKIVAAARRSFDSGIIDLAVMLPPPPSFQFAMLESQRKGVLPRDPWIRHDSKSIRRAKAIMRSERAEISSTMPFYWHKGDKKPYFHPPAFIDDIRSDKLLLCNKEGQSNDSVNSGYFYGERKRKLPKIEDVQNSLLYKKCTRRWKVSVKVNNVTSRNSLFSNVTYPGSNNQQVMLCQAILPFSIQLGENISIQTATQLDRDGLASLLGSYDCRSYLEKDIKRGQRRTNVGRTRLIWSGIRPTSTNKTTFYSLLDGKQIEAKRPREVKVSLRLNGIPLTKSILAGEKIESDSFINTPEEIEESIRVNTEIHDSSTMVSYKDEKLSSLISFDNSTCELDVQTYMKMLMKKRTKKTSSKGYSNLNLNDKFRPTIIQGGWTKFLPPKIECVPLDDGTFRVFCDVPGKLPECSVHDSLNMIANGNLCTICWTGGNDKVVLECVCCGLLAHNECCLDRDFEYKGKDWRCSVCRYFFWPVSRKSNRSTKLPSRFTEDVDFTSAGLHPNKRLSSRPNPKCSLCPHSGGAMCRFVNGNENNSSQEKRWTHEICRIWCRSPKEGEKKELLSSGKPPYACSLAKTCAICGMGEKINQEKGSKEEGQCSTFAAYIDGEGKNDRSLQGLTRCAAKGCLVTFHPFCAILASKLSPSQSQHNISNFKSIPSELESLYHQDFKHCNEYTLKLIRLNRKEDIYGNLSGNRKSSIVPIAFCGIHNPKRNNSFYGSPPAAEILSSTMHIPNMKG